MRHCATPVGVRDRVCATRRRRVGRDDGGAFGHARDGRERADPTVVSRSRAARKCFFFVLSAEQAKKKDVIGF